MNKYDYIEEDDDEEDDGTIKERRKRRIKNKKNKNKFNKRLANSPKKIKGFIQNRPRNHNWHELIDDEEEDYEINY